MQIAIEKDYIWILILVRPVVNLLEQLHWSPVQGLSGQGFLPVVANDDSKSFGYPSSTGASEGTVVER